MNALNFEFVKKDEWAIQFERILRLKFWDGRLSSGVRGYELRDLESFNWVEFGNCFESTLMRMLREVKDARQRCESMAMQIYFGSSFVFAVRNWVLEFDDREKLTKHLHQCMAKTGADERARRHFAEEGKPAGDEEFDFHLLFRAKLVYLFGMLMKSALSPGQRIPKPEEIGYQKEGERAVAELKIAGKLPMAADERMQHVGQKMFASGNRFVVVAGNGTLHALFDPNGEGF